MSHGQHPPSLRRDLTTRPSVRPSIRPFHEINPLTRLAICWILGALAARAYEKVAFSEYPTAVGRTLKGGAFAAGLLILATQLRLASDGLAGPVDPDVVSAPHILHEFIYVKFPSFKFFNNTS